MRNDRRVFDFVTDEHGIRTFVELNKQERPNVAATLPPPAVPARVNGRSAIRHPHTELWQACLDRGGPNFDEADALAAKVGVTAAVELVRAHGPGASMAALVAKVWGKGGA